MLSQLFQIRIKIFIENWSCENTHDTCVRLYKNKATYDDAKAYCNLINADLVTLYDQTYQSWVIRLFFVKDCLLLVKTQNDHFSRFLACRYVDWYLLDRYERSRRR